MILFLCWEPDAGYTIHDAREVEARDAEEAAESYCEADWTDEAWSNARCMRGVSVAVIAAPIGLDAPLPDPEDSERFDVQIGFDPSFTAFPETPR